MSQVIRTAAHRSAAAHLDKVDGRLGPDDLWRLIWRQVLKPTAESQGRDLEEREELTSRLSIVAAEKVAAIRAARPILRASDLEAVEGAVLEAVGAERRAYRRENESVQLDTDSGTAAILEAAEAAGAERSRRQNVTLGRIGPDPITAPERAACPTGHGTATVRAAILSGMFPAVTAAEWAAAEKCSAPVFQKRAEDGRTKLRKMPPAEAAEILQRFCDDFTAAEPTARLDNLEAAARFLRTLLGGGGHGHGHAAPLPDNGWRDRGPEAAAPKLRKRRPAAPRIDRTGDNPRWTPRRQAADLPARVPEADFTAARRVARQAADLEAARRKADLEAAESDPNRDADGNRRPPARTFLTARS